MPGGRGKPVRACVMCKWPKYCGNSKERYTRSESVDRFTADEEIAEALHERPRRM